MISTETKLYVQLEPDQAAKVELLSIQEKLAPHGRVVNEASLHMTILHIGLASRLIDSVVPHTAATTNDILLRLALLADELESAILQRDFTTCTLYPSGFDFLGSHKTSYVITFEPTLELIGLHEVCLDLLKSFLGDIGIQDVDIFMMNDANLRYTLKLLPHVTLARSYRGEINIPLPSTMGFMMMPTEQPGDAHYSSV